MLGQDPHVFLFFCWFPPIQFFGNRGLMSFLIVVCDCLTVQPTPSSLYNKLQFHQEQTSTGSESISAAKTHHNTFISSMQVLMCEPCCTKTYNRSPSATDAKDRRHSGKSQIEPSSRPQNRLHVASSNDGSENEQETTRQQVILDAHLGFHSPNEKILKESKSMGASGPSMNQNY